MNSGLARLLLGAAWLRLSAIAAEPARPDFARDIQPIFIKRCYECHGPDKQKSNLRLDRKADALRGGKSAGPAFVAGKAAESELFRRVTAQNPEDVMPPKGEPLTPPQIALLKAWIEQGADWPEEKTHWAFIKPVRPAVPSHPANGWARNEIDRFILDRLRTEGLSPSTEADRATLLRRLSLDLTGLPPTLAELDAFLADRDPDAYEQAVDRLLASPHFGEHFARSWLDLARYADSNGYQVDLARSIWPYREWVIKAINANMPFDQFTIEQLAGDLLPKASLDQKIATGFNRNTKTNDEGGGDDEEYRTKAVKDRVATTAATWLGLTMACAECHSHKYDPISQEEYYRFYAFFNNTADRGNGTEPSLPVPAPPLEDKLGYVRGRIAALQQQLAASEKILPAEQKQWERRMAGKLDQWVPLDLTNAVSTGGATLTNLPDQSLLATGVNSMYDTYTMEAPARLPQITAVLLEVLPDPSLPRSGPGRWRLTGNFILDEFGLGVAAIGQTNFTPVFFSRATADWEQRYYRAEHAVDRNPKTGWAVAPRFGERHFLIAELKEPLVVKDGAQLAFRFDSYHGNNHVIGRLRLSVTGEKDANLLWPIPPEAAAVLKIAERRRTPAQKQVLSAHYRTVSPEMRRLERELFGLREREQEIVNRKHSTLVMKERDEPRKTFIHVRGNFLEQGSEVTPGVPAVFPPLPSDQPPNRLTLARWLVGPENPLTARVTVNRLWERIFGVGLVKTSEDFGKQGEAPSHPGLLDWLACEFMLPAAPVGNASSSSPPWNLKHIIKLMVMSATYRQSAATDTERLEKDLYNRLLARGPRFRMDPEMIRDHALAASGLLNPEIGGPSVYPVQVPNLWKELGFLRPEIGMDEWPVSEGPDLYRRGLYTFWRRVCTYPTFATFDAPSRDVCVSRRPRTNTPLQALAALNDPVSLEMARVLAQRVMREGGARTEQQMEFAFRLCTSRPPTKSERERLLGFYGQQLKGFARDVQSAEALLRHGSADRPADLDVRKLAAWMMVGNVLLNLDETLTKG